MNREARETEASCCRLADLTIELVEENIGLLDGQLRD
jgi:hypothetical protein